MLLTASTVVTLTHRPNSLDVWVLTCFVIEGRILYLILAVPYFSEIRNRKIKNQAGNYSSVRLCQNSKMLIQSYYLYDKLCLLAPAPACWLNLLQSCGVICEN